MDERAARDHRRARRHAVARWMIEAATERRLAGDWRGACRAANVAVAVDLAVVARTFGPAVAERVEDELRHLAPDLLRWHLATAPPEQVTTPLTRYGGASLLVQRPTRASSRLELRIGSFRPELSRYSLHLSRERWDARRTGELLQRAGGYDGHLPFFTADGRRLPEAGFTDAERIILMQELGPFPAWRAAGLRFDVSTFTGPAYRFHAGAYLDTARVGLTTLVDAARRAAADAGSDAVALTFRGGTIHLSELDGPAPLARSGTDKDAAVPRLPASLQNRPVDFDLVRLGELPIDELHPLVAAALFPAHPPVAGPPVEPVEIEPVPVSCNGEWHVLTMRDGSFVLPHRPEELDRELAMRAIGGRLHGCFAAHQAWRDPAVGLPRPLRRLQERLLLRIRYGDERALSTLLDAGLDPHMRDRAGNTLLHLLAPLPDAALLPRLLAAGLDPHARNAAGATPLDTARTHCNTELADALRQFPRSG